MEYLRKQRVRKDREFDRELHMAAKDEFKKRFGHANYKRHVLRKIKNEMRSKV